MVVLDPSVVVLEENDWIVDRVVPPSPEITFFLYSIPAAMWVPITPATTIRVMILKIVYPPCFLFQHNSSRRVPLEARFECATGSTC